MLASLQYLIKRKKMVSIKQKPIFFEALFQTKHIAGMNTQDFS